MDDNSKLREDMLKLKMNLKGEIKGSKLDVYKAIFYYWACTIISYFRWGFSCC